jgi:leader peptidase (prepilin peptidase)/N-methyltransferase
MIFIPIFIFLLGLLVGSFLNVVIIRMNTGRTVVHGRSKCDACSRSLAWYELVPVFSFLALRGKCRTCKKRISFQHPIVELSTAIIFSLLYASIVLPDLFSPHVWIVYLGAIVAAALLIVIFAYDLRHKIIPDEAMYPLLLLSVIAAFWRAWFVPGLTLGHALVYGILAALPFFLLWALSKGRLMGFGDVKLTLAFGWLVGASAALAAVTIAFFIGGITGLFLIGLSKQYKMKSQIPFGPFLIIGLAVAVLFHISFRNFFPML